MTLPVLALEFGAAAADYFVAAEAYAPMAAAVCEALPSCSNVASDGIASDGLSFWNAAMMVPAVLTEGAALALGSQFEALKPGGWSTGGLVTPENIPFILGGSTQAPVTDLSPKANGSNNITLWGTKTPGFLEHTSDLTHIQDTDTNAAPTSSTAMYSQNSTPEDEASRIDISEAGRNSLTFNNDKYATLTDAKIVGQLNHGRLTMDVNTHGDYGRGATTSGTLDQAAVFEKVFGQLNGTGHLPISSVKIRVRSITPLASASPTEAAGEIITGISESLDRAGIKPSDKPTIVKSNNFQSNFEVYEAEFRKPK